jgi:hypothetical protein
MEKRANTQANYQPPAIARRESVKGLLNKGHGGHKSPDGPYGGYHPR